MADHIDVDALPSKGAGRTPRNRSRLTTGKRVASSNQGKATTLPTNPTSTSLATTTSSTSSSSSAQPPLDKLTLKRKLPAKEVDEVKTVKRNKASTSQQNKKESTGKETSKSKAKAKAPSSTAKKEIEATGGGGSSSVGGGKKNQSLSNNRLLRKRKIIQEKPESTTESDSSDSSEESSSEESEAEPDLRRGRVAVAARKEKSKQTDSLTVTNKKSTVTKGTEVKKKTKPDGTKKEPIHSQSTVCDTEIISSRLRNLPSRAAAASHARTKKLTAASLPVKKKSPRISPVDNSGTVSTSEASTKTSQPLGGEKGLNYRLRSSSRADSEDKQKKGKSERSTNKKEESSQGAAAVDKSKSSRSRSKSAPKEVHTSQSHHSEEVTGTGRGGRGRSGTTGASNNTTGSCASSRCGRGGGPASTGEGPVSKNSEAGMNGSSSSNNQQSSTSSSSSRVETNNTQTNSSTAAAAGAATSNSAGGLPTIGPASAASAASAFSRGLAMFSGDTEADETDMGRLQALLESRGLPPNLFGTLAPRMQQLLHRGMHASSGNVTKAQQLLQGLQSTGDEGQQLQAAIEMCQLLVMGNEDTLAGFPVKQTVPALIQLLSMEHNFDIMNHACRALTYMMEALPRSTPVVAEAVPVFLEKLQVIQCMDVAEQSLTALEMLSRRHAKAILQAKGVGACLTFLDFFSITAQRAALVITANCMQNLHPEEFHLIKESLQFMASRLTHQDRKSVESVCLGFSRMVDSFMSDPKRLEEIGSSELLANLQSLLVVTPPVVSTSTFILVLRMMAQLCSRSPTIAVKLLEENIVGTLSSLLLGATAAIDLDVDVELVQRNPQELLEIVNLISELLPKLPADGIFVVNSMLTNSIVMAHDTVRWQWKDDRSQWVAYSAFDSRVIEAAHQSGEDEISLSVQGRTYTIDFLGMQQINEDTGTARTVQRKINPFLSFKTGGFAADAKIADERETYLSTRPDFASPFLRPLFALLSEANSSSAGPAVRSSCLKTLLRIVHYLPPDSLKKGLKPQLVSNTLASMLGSSDLKIVVGAFQLCTLFMDKLADEYSIHFRRDGVFHQITRISSSEVTGISPVKNDGAGTSSASIAATPPLEGLTLDMGLLTANAGTSGSLTLASLGLGANATISNLPPDALIPVVNLNMPRKITAVKAEESTGGKSKLGEGSSVSMTGLSLATALPCVTGQSSGESISLPSIMIPTAHTSSTSSLVSSSIIETRSHSAGIESSEGGGAASLQAFKIDALIRKRDRGDRSSPTANNTSTSVVDPKAKPTDLSQTESLKTEESNHSPVDDMFKRKRISKRSIPTSTTRRTRQKDPTGSSSSTAFGVLEASAGSPPTGSGSSSTVAPAPVATSKRSGKSGFFASLHPSRWARGGGSSNNASGTSSSSATNSGSGNSGSVGVAPTNLASRSSSGAMVISTYKEQVKAWLKEQSVAFSKKYNPADVETSDGDSNAEQLGVLPKLNQIIQNLQKNNGHIEPLTELRKVILGSDISSFEINHSGLIIALLTFLTEDDVTRDSRLRMFLHVFADCPLDFLSGDELDTSSISNSSALSALVLKLNSCLSQVEQFQVKVHEVHTNPTNSRSASAAPTSALRFFNTHQLKCNLQRHPSCNTLRQWKGGPVKIDSLALVQTIERYLIAKGFGRVRESRDSGDSEDDNSDDDMEDSLAAAVISQGGGRHQLQFLIGDNSLPYTMTVYQAIRQFGAGGSGEPGGDLGADFDSSAALLTSSNIWSQTHTIYYRPLPQDANSAVSSNAVSKKSKSKGSKNTSFGKKKDPLWIAGAVPDPVPPYLPYLTPKLPDAVTISDPCLPVLTLLRVIHSVCRYWRYLYWPILNSQPLVPLSEFVNSKLSAKAQRQLQDPVIILAGNLPQWLQQIGVHCPFLFPFETRQMLFYSTTFDRDRALQRLLDSAPELNGSEREDRITPRLDRRKRQISRDNILHHAEQIMSDFGSARPLLEVQYENEVGTGLGPTLEFYALVSQELQKSDLDLWHHDSSTDISISDELMSSSSSTGKGKAKLKSYVQSNVGLFPKPVGKSAKAATLTKVKNKFKFLGWFMAKAVMDSRMVDLPLSNALYKYMLHGGSSMCLADVVDVDSTVARSIRQLVGVVSQKKKLETKLTAVDLAKALDALTLDGCQIDNLGLDFTLPGHPSIDLKKGGKDIPVTVHNLEEYIKLVCYWMLFGGINAQLESFKEGFDLVFTSSSLAMFYPEELEMVFCGATQSGNENWDVKILMECCRPDHGYTHQSRAIRFLFETMSQYDAKDRRKFLQFVTGSPRLPVGGFKALQPPLTIVKKTAEGMMADTDKYLPSVMTCVNYLKLPDYSTIEIMGERMSVAVNEGRLSFHLS